MGARASRRAVIAGAITAGVVAAVPAQALVQTDAAFFAALRAYRAMVAEYEADPDDSDEAMNAGADRLYDAEAELLLMPVATVAAASAKLVLVGEHAVDIDIEVDGKIVHGIDLVVRDLDRIAERERMA